MMWISAWRGLAAVLSVMRLAFLGGCLFWHAGLAGSWLGWQADFSGRLAFLVGCQVKLAWQ
eukprot:12418873-Karenia_brevis.AAC.1